MKQFCLGCFEKYDDEFNVCPYCGYVKGTKPLQSFYLEPGTILEERYIIGKVIGSGGFGVTYIGWDALLEKKIAIKEYLPSEFSNREEGISKVTIFGGDKTRYFNQGKQKFIDEAQVLAKFNRSDGIVCVYKTFEVNNTAYIVMDYLEGETLADRIKREGKLTVEEALSIIMPILNSLEEVHQEGIVHRDIAPDNIFLTVDGRVKLLDFGAARAVSSSSSKSLTVILKEGYAPFEQYSSTGNIGTWSDVYALGACLYHMITGELPIQSIDRLGKDLLKTPNKIVKIPKNLNNAIMNAMIVDEKQRTQTVTLFKEEIEDIQTELKKVELLKRESGNIPPIVKKICTGAVIIGVVLSLLIMTGIIDLSNFVSGPSVVLDDGEVFVPGVLNKMKSDAEDMAENEGLLLKVTDSQQSDKVEADKVLSQNPMPGQVRNKGGTLEVVISSGPSTIMTPDVTYYYKDMANEMLTGLGFKVKYKEVFNDFIAPNAIVSQDSEPNSIKGLGSTITLMVSKGSEKKVSGSGDVGNYVNKQFDEVCKDVKKSGLYIVVKEKQYSATVEKGAIISQNPQNGTVDVGSIIEVVLSNGKEKVKVPYVNYKKEEDAIRLLKEVKLQVKTIYQESDTISKGNVISQSIDADSVVDEGTVINIVISKGSKRASQAEEITKKPSQSNTNKTDSSSSSNSSSSTSNSSNSTSNSSSETSSGTNGSSNSSSSKPDSKPSEESPVIESKWSDWTEDKSLLNNNEYISESKTQYSSRTKKNESYWDSSFSHWSTVNPGSAANMQVTTRTIYRYYYFVCSECGYHTAYWNSTGGNSWSGTQVCPNGWNHLAYENSFREKWFPQKYGSGNYVDKNKRSLYIEGTLYYWDVRSSEQYTKTEYGKKYYHEKYSYSNWSAYQDNKITPSSTVEVRTRMVYRYKKK